MKELVKEIRLNYPCGSLAFYHDGNEGEIIHSYMVASGEDDVDWEVDTVSVEEAMALIDKHGIRSQKIYD